MKHFTHTGRAVRRWLSSVVRPIQRESLRQLRWRRQYRDSRWHPSFRPRVPWWFTGCQCVAFLWGVFAFLVLLAALYVAFVGLGWLLFVRW